MQQDQIRHGFRIVRNGPAAQDTFDKGVNIAEYALVEYTAEQYQTLGTGH